MSSTLSFYADNAEDFFRRTVSLDLEPLYRRFVPHLPAGGAVLDAGCGSGRDSAAFLQAGFAVTAFDAVPELARRAAELTGLEVAVSRFDEFHSRIPFDGIWASASLLHVPEGDLPGVIRHLAGFLKPGGVFYMSFKHGNGETVRGPRRFTDMDEDGFARLADALSGTLALSETWTSEDTRLMRDGERWMNGLWRTS